MPEEVKPQKSLREWQAELKAQKAQVPIALTPEQLAEFQNAQNGQGDTIGAKPDQPPSETRSPRTNDPGANLTGKKGAKPPKPNSELPKSLLKACGHREATSEVLAQPCRACQKEGWKKEGKGGGRDYQDRGRLPHKSRYEIEYDEITETWAGELRIPGIDDGEEMDFDGEKGGAFRLLQLLDDKYRNWVKRKNPAPVVEEVKPPVTEETVPAVEEQGADHAK